MRPRTHGRCSCFAVFSLGPSWKGPFAPWKPVTARLPVRQMRSWIASRPVCVTRNFSPMHGFDSTRTPDGRHTIVPKENPDVETRSLTPVCCLYPANRRRRASQKVKRQLLVLRVRSTCVRTEILNLQASHCACAALLLGSALRVTCPPINPTHHTRAECGLCSDPGTALSQFVLHRRYHSIFLGGDSGVRIRLGIILVVIGTTNFNNNKHGTNWPA